MRAHTHVYHTCARAALRQSITASSHANMCMCSQRQGAVYVYMRHTWHKERELEVDAFMKLRERRHQLHRVALLHAMEEEHALPRLLSASLRKPRCARLDGLGCVRSIETNGSLASHYHLTSTGPRAARLLAASWWKRHRCCHRRESYPRIACSSRSSCVVCIAHIIRSMRLRDCSHPFRTKRHYQCGMHAMMCSLQSNTHGVAIVALVETRRRLERRLPPRSLRTKRNRPAVADSAT